MELQFHTATKYTLWKWGHFDWAKTTFKMLLASQFLVYLFKRFRSFNAENLKSVGQRAAKLPAIKLWEWLNRDRGSNPSRLADWGRGQLADFFLRPPTLTASNFAALWPKDPKFSALKDLNLFYTMSKVQDASSFFDCQIGPPPSTSSLDKIVCVQL